MVHTLDIADRTTVDNNLVLNPVIILILIVLDITNSRKFFCGLFFNSLFFGCSFFNCSFFDNLLLEAFNLAYHNLT